MTTQPAKERVADYPRPPRVEPTSKRIRVIFNGVTIADTSRAHRVLETTHPPVYYIPQDDIQMAYLKSTSRHTVCEFKGEASYWTVEVDGRTEANSAWSYAKPLPGFEPIRDAIAFYAGRMDACYVDDEKVTPQPGDFYGGWITSDIEGPFKGAPGTMHW